MKTVRLLKAKSRLSSLLEQVKRGEEVTITRHGKAVARLVPVGAVSRDRLKNTVAPLKAFQRGSRLSDLSTKDPDRRRGAPKSHVYGSAASRRPSPRKLKARTTRITGTTGSMSQG